MRTIITSAMCLLVGCTSGGSSSSDVVAALDHTGGCGEIIFQAWATDRTAELSFSVDLDAFSGPISRTFAASELQSFDLVVGSNLMTEACPDYGDDTRMVDQSFTRATAGTVQVELAAPEPDQNPTASAVIDGLILETYDHAERITIEHFEINDAAVGWFGG